MYVLLLSSFLLFCHYYCYYYYYYYYYLYYSYFYQTNSNVRF